MKKMNIYLPDDLYMMLRGNAYRSSRSMSELIREALKERFGKHEDATGGTIRGNPFAPIIGIASDKDGFTDVSVNHDYYLYGGEKKVETPE